MTESNTGAAAEMPRYKCHKTVWALEIESIELDSTKAKTEGDRETDGSAMITPSDPGFAPFRVDHDYLRRHKPQPGGFYVVYEDGYKSFSPAKAFQQGYARLVESVGGEARALAQAIQQLVGEASMCWSPRPEGVFDSRAAISVADRILALLPPSTPSGAAPGLTIEYVMLSVTVVSNKGSAGQFDDSIAHIVQRYLAEYHGVVRVSAEVLYRHTKIEQHVAGCECGTCSPATQDKEAS